MTYDSKEGLEKLFDNKDFQVDIRPKPSPEEFKKLIKDYDGLLIRSEVKVTQEIIAAASKMKFIGRAGTGVDNVDKNAATQRGIVVANVPGGNTISAAEHTIGLMLSMARNIPQAYQSLKGKKWDRKNFMGTELYGKYLGLIGLGRIGSEVAKRMIAFGMKIIAYDPFANDTLLRSYDIDLIPLDDVLINADYISIHSPLNDSTKGMINASAIAKMKDGVRIINCARGPIINEKDLSDAIKSGKVKAAALDVFAKEPPDDWTIVETDNVIATPHLAASTEEAQVKIAQEMSDVMIDFFSKGIIRNAVNVPAIDWETYKRMKPYIDLTEKIGLFQGQIAQGAIKEVEIKYCGNLCSYQTKALTITYLQGLLSPMISDMDKKVNIVNAHVIAQERGIKVKESTETQIQDYAGLIIAKILTDKGEQKIAATMFNDANPRIVSIDGLGVDVIPQGRMILIENEDKPGVVGNLAKLLGDSDVNIAGMNLARKDIGGQALAIIEIDGDISADIVDKILQIGGIKKAKFISLERD
jgi:D-3-phosphoglycerate dehydrogenase